MLSSLFIPTHFHRLFLAGGGLYVCGSLLTFGIGILVARSMGPENLGVYGVAMATAFFGAIAAAGGISLNATRGIATEIARGDHETASDLLKWSVFTVLRLAVSISFVVGVYLYSIMHASLGLAVSAMFVSTLMAMIMLHVAVVRGTGAEVIGQAIDIVVKPAVQLLLISCAVLLLGEIQPTLALGLTAVSLIVAMLLGFNVVARVWRSGTSVAADRDPIQVQSWRHASAKMSLTRVLLAAEGSLPLILIGLLSSPYEAGILRLSVSVYVILNSACTLVNTMMESVTAKLVETQDERRLRQWTAAACLAMTVPTAVAVIAFVFLGEPFLHLAFGKEFEEAWSPILILAAGAIASALAGNGMQLLHAARSESVVTWAFLVSLPVCAVLTILLTPQFGAAGAACAAAAALLSRVTFLAIASWRILRIDPSIIGSAWYLVRLTRVQ